MNRFHKTFVKFQYFIIISLALVLILFIFNKGRSYYGSFKVVENTEKLSDKSENQQNLNRYPGYDAYKYCIPRIKPVTYSTSKDLCITPIFNFDNNFQLNLFSIRKSGCAATIVVLSDSNTFFSDETNKLILLFKVKIVKGKFPSDSLLKRHVDFMRDTLCFEFLKMIQKSIDSNEAKYERVFFFDSFDVYFEKDPFSYFEKEDVVYFFQESSVTLAESSFNADGVSGCFGSDALQRIINKPIICSGTMAAGSVRAFIQFLDYFVHLKCFKDENCPYDQGALIYVIHAGLLRKNKIKFLVFPPDGPVAACKIGPINIMTRISKKNKRYIQIESSNNGHVFEVVHQYTAIPQIKEGFYEKTNFQAFIAAHENKLRKSEFQTTTIKIK